MLAADACSWHCSQAPRRKAFYLAPHSAVALARCGAALLPRASLGTSPGHRWLQGRHVVASSASVSTCIFLACARPGRKRRCCPCGRDRGTCSAPWCFFRVAAFYRRSHLRGVGETLEEPAASRRAQIVEGGAAEKRLCWEASSRQQDNCCAADDGGGTTADGAANEDGVTSSRSARLGALSRSRLYNILLVVNPSVAQGCSLYFCLLSARAPAAAGPRSPRAYPFSHILLSLKHASLEGASPTAAEPLCACSRQ